MGEIRDPNMLYCDEPSIVQQHLKEDCDINQIIARVLRGGVISHVNERVAKYGDFSNVPDYQASLNFIKKADAMFYELDPVIRERFQNDPGQLIAFMNDPSNRQEAIELGLIPKPKEASGGQPEKPAEGGEKAPTGPAQ